MKGGRNQQKLRMARKKAARLQKQIADEPAAHVHVLEDLQALLRDVRVVISTQELKMDRLAREGGKTHGP